MILLHRYHSYNCSTNTHDTGVAIGQPSKPRTIRQQAFVHVSDYAANIMIQKKATAVPVTQQPYEYDYISQDVAISQRRTYPSWLLLVQGRDAGDMHLSWSVLA